MTKRKTYQCRIEKHVRIINKITKEQKLCYSIKEAAEYLNLNYQTFRKIVNKKKYNEILEKYDIICSQL